MKKNKRAFGSVAWQREQTDEIIRKTIAGEPLNGFDKAFIMVQQQHLIDQMKKRYKKEKLKKVV